jgi:hypothetical protein
MQTKTQQPIVSIAEAAKLLGYKPAYFYRVYPKLVKRGLRELKAHPKAAPRFLVSDLIETMAKIGKGEK